MTQTLVNSCQAFHEQGWICFFGVLDLKTGSSFPRLGAGSQVPLVFVHFGADFLDNVLHHRSSCLGLFVVCSATGVCVWVGEMIQLLRCSTQPVSVFQVLKQSGTVIKSRNANKFTASSSVIRHRQHL